MTVSRPDLELFRRRLLARGASGVLLVALLFVLLLMSRAVAFGSGHIWAMAEGALLGGIAAAHCRRRIQRDLLETDWTFDAAWMGMPVAGILFVLSPWAGTLSPAATVILGARLVLLAQEAFALGRVEALLARPQSASLPRIRHLRLPPAEPAAAEVRGVDVLAWNSEGSSRCPVCAEELTQVPVRCADCWTPHHEDCFRYNSGCGVYACGGSELKASPIPVAQTARAQRSPLPLRRAS
ncbi:MAG: hypothetical protein HY816_16425 [Candidatus Wallbacteria bacterium]|nr:hypothetical protein [Candidatus Wallbacteria bacterium]